MGAGWSGTGWSLAQVILQYFFANRDYKLTMVSSILFLNLGPFARSRSSALAHKRQSLQRLKQ
jgi:hypothetical protein